MDCLEGLKRLPDSCVDLIMTDPPYLIKDTHAGGRPRLARSIQPISDCLKENDLVSGMNPLVLPELVRVMKRINCYIWCNKAQIPGYLDFFVDELGCSFDMVVWWKTNPPPTFHNKYLSDEEYCLYFRKGGYCQPDFYEKAKTVYFQPINIYDKKDYPHPTIKPINIIKNLIENSSRPGDLVLDPFLGSGTTAAACMELGRNYLGYEINPEYDRTPAKEVSRRTESGMEIFDGEYNCYRIEDFLVKCFFPIDDTLVMAGHRLTGREKEECFDPVPDAMIDVTEFLNETYIDVDRLLKKVSQIDK